MYRCDGSAFCYKESNFIHPQFDRLQDLSAYSGAVTLSLLHIQARLLLSPTSHLSVVEARALKHLAHASTVVDILRAVPHATARHRFLLPLDVAHRSGMRPSDIYNSRDQAAGLRETTYQLYREAKQDFSAVGDLLTQSKSSAQNLGTRKMILVQTVPIQSWLRGLEKVDFGLFDARLLRRNWKVPFQMWWAARTSRYRST